MYIDTVKNLLLCWTKFSFAVLLFFMVIIETIFKLNHDYLKVKKNDTLVLLINYLTIYNGLFLNKIFNNVQCFCESIDRVYGETKTSVMIITYLYWTCITINRVSNFKILHCICCSYNCFQKHIRLTYLAFVCPCTFPFP